MGHVSRTSKCIFMSIAVLIAIVIGTTGLTGTGITTNATPSAFRFDDITRAAGIHFVHNNGAFGKKWLPETMGPGVAFIDYDNDGWQDVLIVNGSDFPGHVHHHATLALYHNNHDGTLTDVTRK